MSEWEWFLLTLSIAGLIFLVRYTDGPWDIFFNFRIWIGIYNLIGNDGKMYESTEDKFFAKLISCPWCFATWVVFPLSIIFHGWDFYLYWLSSVFVIGFLIELVLLIKKYNED